MMKESIHSISLSYGDALFRIYRFALNPDENLEDESLHSHRFYEIHVALNGSYSYSVGGTSVTLKQNRALIIPPGVDHKSVSYHHTAYEYAVLSFSLSETERDGGCYSYFLRTLDACALTPVSIPAALVQRVTDLHRMEIGNPIAELCYMKMQASALIFELFNHLNGFSAPSKSPAGLGCGECDRLILLDALMQTTRSLSDIAAVVGYSPRHTGRLIKKIYGCSLSEYRALHAKDKKRKKQ